MMSNNFGEDDYLTTTGAPLPDRANKFDVGGIVGLPLIIFAATITFLTMLLFICWCVRRRYIQFRRWWGNRPAYMMNHYRWVARSEDPQWHSTDPDEVRFSDNPHYASRQQSVEQFQPPHRLSQESRGSSLQSKNVPLVNVNEGQSQRARSEGEIAPPPRRSPRHNQGDDDVVQSLPQLDQLSAQPWDSDWGRKRDVDTFRERLMREAREVRRMNILERNQLLRKESSLQLFQQLSANYYLRF
ncbi:hypothetical protein HELRODRAFT_189904 [Helobdella robusta]|uniref:Uncharacterized protein n=1 Tax=Helobdella robusta TaxID=6412 RepID=T1FRG8_HELRO|nr:hypothetical protein HELRODRAFT_189904 [Helobdella robusta]ESN90581.1 hypothetical protein HELRODRAFT_189904 [Helobdella robusta]